MTNERRARLSESVLLIGGPHDRQVVDKTTGITPVILLTPPHPPTLLAQTLPQARWNEATCWYETVWDSR